jgi:hypothetical protein
MGGQSDDCSQQGGQQLFFGRELVCGFVGEQPGYGNPDESVKSIPDQVDRGNLVSEELNGKQGNGRGDHGPSCKDVQSWGEWEMSYARQQAQGGHSGIEVQARGEGDSGHQGEQFVRRDLQQVEHWSLEGNDTASGEMERVLDRSSQSCGGFRSPGLPDAEVSCALSMAQEFGDESEARARKWKMASCFEGMGAPLRVAE